MLHRNLIGQRLLALFMLGWVLFNYPLLSLFAGAREWLGVPAIYVYLFSAWVLLILLMGWIAEDRGHRRAPHESMNPAAPADSGK